MTTATLVSVIIPVRDGELYLAEAVRSVLEQSYRHVDPIVVDDGSEDGTPELLSAFGTTVRSVRQEPAGTAAAVNRGVELARGDFLAFLDADDLWTRQKLELQMAALAGNTKLDLVFGHVRHFHSPELSADERAAVACPAEAMPGPSKGTMLVRRESFVRVGAFDTTWRVGDFVDWYARAQECGLVAETLPDVVMLRRVHMRNTSRRAQDAYVDYARVARAALTRRRAGT